MCIRYLSLTKNTFSTYQLSVSQLIDLKWHNARIVRHLNEFKSVALPVCSVGNYSNNITAYKVTEDNISSNVEKLLNKILNDNMQLAKILQ